MAEPLPTSGGAANIIRLLPGRKPRTPGSQPLPQVKERGSLARRSSVELGHLLASQARYPTSSGARRLGLPRLHRALPRRCALPDIALQGWSARGEGGLGPGSAEALPGRCLRRADAGVNGERRQDPRALPEGGGSMARVGFTARTIRRFPRSEPPSGRNGPRQRRHGRFSSADVAVTMSHRAATRRLSRTCHGGSVLASDL
jgi:hypothetical protein